MGAKSDAKSMADTVPGGADTQRPALHLRCFGMTDRGKVRSRNEDHFLVADMTKALHVQRTSLPHPKTRFGKRQAHLFLVADGLGGHQAGERASALTIESVEEFALNTIPWFFQLEGSEGQRLIKEFQQGLLKIDERLCDMSSQRPELRGMATTLTLAYLFGDRLLVAHVGDSRCYLLRDGKLFQLTQDHTVVAEMIRRGALQPEQAKQHEYRNVITNAMGGSEVGVDVDIQRYDVRAGDILMLCTDGLTEMVPIQTICDILQSTDEPRSACERLVSLANKNGGKDNITVIVGRCEPATSHTRRTEVKSETKLGKD